MREDLEPRGARVMRRRARVVAAGRVWSAARSRAESPRDVWYCRQAMIAATQIAITMPRRVQTCQRATDPSA